MRGKVWLVGAGPGDPALITIRGRDVLASAEVVLHDALSHPVLLELCPRAEIRDVGKRYGQPSPTQESITEQLVALAREGRRVVRLKGGDPLLFARGAEEALALAAAGVPFEIVPGIASPVAASAYAGISLTHRGLSSSVTFITGSDRDAVEWSPAAWERLATATDTICVLMGLRRLEAISEALIRGGRRPATPAAMVQWGARPEQRVVTATLGTIAEAVRGARLKSPAILFVGEVVGLRSELAWYDRQPLIGRRILVPRPLRQARETAAAVRLRGAEPVVFPVIEILEAPDPTAFSRAVRELSRYEWVVFTSVNGVSATFAELDRQGRDCRAFGTARVAAIGPRTAAALRDGGIAADRVADEYIAESLVEALLDGGPPARVLLLRAAEAREVLPERLRAAGTEVEVVAAYETRPVDAVRRAELRRVLEQCGVDTVLLTSASIAKSFAAALGPAPLAAPPFFASIGPATSAAARAAGLQVGVEALTYTVDGLLDALEGGARGSG
ncbi:MAG: uroporphyrinogen-III C-methyltransferase [Polyangiaceae bacterium]|nr:uroporphyrinogen-III C-methyltransferase [Polyangiaceae bacterium]